MGNSLKKWYNAIRNSITNDKGGKKCDNIIENAYTLLNERVNI